jgi:Tfp pilus assembly protein PilO
MKMLFGKRQQAAIFVLAVLLVADFVFFGVVPSRHRLRQIRQKRSERLSLISSADAASQKLSQLKEEIALLEATVGDYGRKVPAATELGGFLHKIAELMNEHNLQEQFVQPAGETQAEGLSCIPLSIRCKGDLQQIFGFCKSLQKLERLVRIEQIILTNDSEFKGQVSMQTKAAIYYHSDGQQGR